MRWERKCGQACGDSGRVGERAKEALVDGLNGLSMMLVWELFSASMFAGRWEWRGRCVRRRELKD